MSTCRWCKGTGDDNRLGNYTVTCPQCKGTGEINQIHKCKFKLVDTHKVEDGPPVQLKQCECGDQIIVQRWSTNSMGNFVGFTVGPKVLGWAEASTPFGKDWATRW